MCSGRDVCDDRWASCDGGMLPCCRAAHLCFVVFLGRFHSCLPLAALLRPLLRFLPRLVCLRLLLGLTLQYLLLQLRVHASKSGIMCVNAWSECQEWEAPAKDLPCCTPPVPTCCTSSCAEEAASSSFFALASLVVACRVSWCWC